jgi:hypothetical protein
MGREGGLREIGNWCCTSCWWVGMSFRGTGELYWGGDCCGTDWKSVLRV